MKSLISTFALIAAVVFLPFYSHGQGTLTITFDQPSPLAPGTAQLITNYSEAGMSFTSIVPGDVNSAFVRQGGGVPGYPVPINGTTYLQAGLGSTLMFRPTDLSAFNLHSVDLAGYSDVVPDFAVEIVGYRSVGGTVTTSFSGSGISFQTFHFGPEFSDLIRVEIPTYGWSLDNLTISVPEPTPWSILLLGGGLLFREQRRSKGKARAIPVSNQNDHR